MMSETSENTIFIRFYLTLCMGAYHLSEVSGHIGLSWNMTNFILGKLSQFDQKKLSVQQHWPVTLIWQIGQTDLASSVFLGV